MKGFGRNPPQKVHPNFAQNLGRQLLGNTSSGLNSDHFARPFPFRNSPQSRRVEMVGCDSFHEFRRVESTPDPNTFEKYRDTPPISIAILLQKYALLLAESSIYTPPICIKIPLPSVSRCFCRSIRVRGRSDTPKSSCVHLERSCADCTFCASLSCNLRGHLQTCQMPDIENSRRNSRKGCRVGHGKAAEKQPEKQLKHPKNSCFDCFSAVFRVFRLFFRLFFGCFTTHSAPFSAVSSAVFNVGHLARL